MVIYFFVRIFVSRFGCLVTYFKFLALKTETKKQDLKKDILFLMTDHLEQYLFQKPVIINLLTYITMSIKYNDIQYNNSYCKLKYGPPYLHQIK